MSPRTLDTFTMDEPGGITVAQACAIQNTPFRLMSMTCLNCSRVSLMAEPAAPIPALFTSPSTCPNSAMAKSTSAAQASGSATSVGRARTCAPPAASSPATSSRRSARRPASTTRPPTALTARAKPTPRPEVAPVMMTTRPSRRKACSGSIMSSGLGAISGTRSGPTGAAGGTLTAQAVKDHYAT